MEDYLIVNDRVVEVIDHWSHGGTEYAKVQGRTISGFVEVPENPRTPDWMLACDECGSIEEIDGEEHLVGAKRHRVNHEGSAELLKRIHEHKTTDHRPQVGRVA